MVTPVFQQLELPVRYRSASDQGRGRSEPSFYRAGGRAFPAKSLEPWFQEATPLRRGLPADPGRSIRAAHAAVVACARVEQTLQRVEVRQVPRPVAPARLE